MSNWLLRATNDWLKPIYERLHELLCAQSVLHADETTLQVLHELNRTPQKKSYMWLYRTSGNTEHPIVLYDYPTSRSGKHPKEFLKGFKGFLHTDSYSGYHSGLPKEITVVGCWAHVRRKFDEALKILPDKDKVGSGALHGKNLCDRLFKVERNFAELSPGERFKARLKESKPLMKELFEWAAHSDALPKTPFGRAVNYALDQRPCWKISCSTAASNCPTTAPSAPSSLLSSAAKTGCSAIHRTAPRPAPPSTASSKPPKKRRYSV